MPDEAVVAVGGEPGLEIFDLDALYVTGTIGRYPADGRGSAYDTMRAIAPLLEPERLILGLPMYTRLHQVHATDGRLLYALAGEPDIRVFHCDGCTHLLPTYFDDLPDFGANDERIATPGCEGEFEFQVTPEGALVYTCDPEGGPWYDETGNVLVPETEWGTYVLRFGHEGTVLRQDGVFDLATQQLTPFSGRLTVVDGFALNQALVTRALPDGYFLLRESNLSIA